MNDLFVGMYLSDRAWEVFAWAATPDDILGFQSKRLIFSSSKVYLKLLLRMFVAASLSTEINAPNFGSLLILHGGMDIKEKLWTLEVFRQIEGPAILFLTKGVGAESLTLVSANNVLFVDQHWNRTYTPGCRGFLTNL